MLSPIIKNLVEMRVGYEIRYPSDCERLSCEIAHTINQFIGVTTLKRLFGFVSGKTTPRMSTLDILAKFLGYRNYDELIHTLDPDRESMQPAIRQLQAADLQKGDRIRLFYEEKYLCLEWEGEAEFRVVKSTDPKLLAGDRVTVRSFHVGNPVFVHRLVRHNTETRDLVLAKVSGLERIETGSQAENGTGQTGDPTTGGGVITSWQPTIYNTQKKFIRNHSHHTDRKKTYV